MQSVKPFNSRTGEERHFYLKPNEDYIVKPMEPSAKKNRDRMCTLIDPGFVSEVTVRFHDTNKEEKINPGDLWPVKQELLLSWTPPGVKP